MKELRGAGARFRGLFKSSLMPEVIYLLPDPVFILAPNGSILEANEAGERLLVSLVPEGSRGSLGSRELQALFQRGAERRLAASPCTIETAEGPLNCEARFGEPDSLGRKTAILADISVWKRALAEKEAVIRQFRLEKDKPVSVCARCGAIRDDRGAWGLPGGLALSGLPQEKLSHGLCPACLAVELGQLGLGTPAGLRAPAMGHRAES